MTKIELINNFIESLYESGYLREDKMFLYKSFAIDWLNDIETEKQESKNYDNFESCRGYEE